MFQVGSTFSKDVNIGAAATVGAALTVTGGQSLQDSRFEKDVTVGEDLNVGAAAVTGISTFTGATKFAESSRFEVYAIGEDVNVGGATTVGGALTVTGNAYFNGNVDIGGDLTFDEVNASNATITGIATLDFLNFAANAYVDKRLCFWYYHHLHCCMLVWVQRWSRCKEHQQPELVSTQSPCIYFRCRW